MYMEEILSGFFTKISFLIMYYIFRMRGEIQETQGLDEEEFLKRTEN